MWSMENNIVVLCGIQRFVLTWLWVWAHGKRLGVRGCVCVVFKVLHGLWCLVCWLVSGEGCVVWLKYSYVLILDKVYILVFLGGWWS